MGHHINKDGQFQSDKYDWCPPGFFVMSFKDRHARRCIRKYIELTYDDGLSEDLETALMNTAHQAKEPD